MRFNERQKQYIISEFVRKFGNDDPMNVEDKGFRYDEDYGKIYKFSEQNDCFVFMDNADNSWEARYCMLCEVVDQQCFDYMLDDLS